MWFCIKNPKQFCFITKIQQDLADNHIRVYPDMDNLDLDEEEINNNVELMVSCDHYAPYTTLTFKVLGDCEVTRLYINHIKFIGNILEM